MAMKTAKTLENARASQVGSEGFLWNEVSAGWLSAAAVGIPRPSPTCLRPFSSKSVLLNSSPFRTMLEILLLLLQFLLLRMALAFCLKSLHLS